MSKETSFLKTGVTLLSRHTLGITPTENNKAVLMHRTPREAKAVYPSDWMRKYN